MKTKKILYFLLIITSLSSCGTKKESYKSKNVEVDTIFNSNFSYNYSNDDYEDLEKLGKLIKKNADNISDIDIYKEKKESNLDSSIKYTIVNEAELRKDPIEDGDNIIEKIPANTKVELIKNLNVDGEKWSKISYNGNKGYVKRNFLKEIK